MKSSWLLTMPSIESARRVSLSLPENGSSSRESQRAPIDRKSAPNTARNDARTSGETSRIAIFPKIGKDAKKSWTNSSATRALRTSGRAPSGSGARSADNGTCRHEGWLDPRRGLDHERGLGGGELTLHVSERDGLVEKRRSRHAGHRSDLRLAVAD